MKDIRGYHWSASQLDAEVSYRYRERLALLCPEGEPTEEDRAQAQAEVTGWIKANFPSNQGISRQL